MNPLDDNQKNKKRQRHFFDVYVYPIVFGLAICGLTYLVTTKYSLDKNDRLFGFVIGVASGIVLYFRNSFKWLPLPNGSFIHKSELTDETNDLVLAKQSYVIEPTDYVASFYYSAISKIILLVCGLTMIGAGIYIISKSSIIFPSLIIIGGIFLFYSGYKEIIDNSPKLKLAKEGLWTKDLGFRPWSSIYKTAIKEEKGSRSSQLYLEIYLKGNDINYPDQRLQLNDMMDKEKIKPMIDDLYNKWAAASIRFCTIGA